MKILEEICNKITSLEAERDFGDITEEGLELLAVLNFCYDLLSRTNKAMSITVETDEEMQKNDFNTIEHKYGICSNELADFTFSLITKRGKVNLRKLLKDIMPKRRQKDIAKNIGIRSATISDFLNNKSSFNIDSYESIINAVIDMKKKKNAGDTDSIL